jgi:hypothetical protein
MVYTVKKIKVLIIADVSVANLCLFFFSLVALIIERAT